MYYLYTETLKNQKVSTEASLLVNVHVPPGSLTVDPLSNWISAWWSSCYVTGLDFCHVAKLAGAL